jgi:hypothetical protein
MGELVDRLYLQGHTIGSNNNSGRVLATGVPRHGVVPTMLVDMLLRIFLLHITRA